MRVLVTGGTGMLGHLLVRQLKDRHRVIFTTHRAAIAIAGAEPLPWDLAEGRRELTGIDAVVHTAALTDVDGCQRDPEAAYRTNVLATRNLAASVPGAYFVYISTDFVFDGARGNYREDDAPAPLSVYGTTKLQGEAEVPAGGCVVRTSIYGLGSGPGRPGLVEKLAARLRRGETLTGFTDQSFTPICCANLAQFIGEILDRRYAGTVHIGSERPCNKHEFITAVARGFGFGPERVREGLSSEVAYLAPRPRDASLDTAKARRTFSARAWSLEESMDAIKREWEERG